MKRKRKRAVRVYRSSIGSIRVFGRGKTEYWNGKKYEDTDYTNESLCRKCDTLLTGPALAAWLREHPKPKGK
jgi:hypothetical protein